MLNFYYYRFCHLRIAQPIINDINMLHSALITHSRKKAIDTISYITLKYNVELDKIAFYMTGRPVIKGEQDELYQDYSQSILESDIEYLINCLIIIGAVRFGVEKSLEHALQKITEYQPEPEEETEFSVEEYEFA